MNKCESHEDLVRYIDRMETGLSDRVKETEKKIESLRDDFSKQVIEHREIEVYVKNLYKRFDELTIQMQLVVTKLDSYLVALTTIQTETTHTKTTQKRGKDLVYEIIKWIVLLGLGMLLNTQKIG